MQKAQHRTAEDANAKAAQRRAELETTEDATSYAITLHECYLDVPRYDENNETVNSMKDIAEVGSRLQ